MVGIPTNGRFTDLIGSPENGHQVRAEEELAPAGLPLRGRLLPLHLPPLPALQVAAVGKVVVGKYH